MEAFWVGLGITVAVIVVLLLLLCGFIFNQLVWRRTIPLPRFLGKIIAGGGGTGRYIRKRRSGGARTFEKPAA